jgi:hypothetical protein
MEGFILTFGMIIMSFVMPMRLTLRNGTNIGCQITFPSPRVDYLHDTYPSIIITRDGVAPSTFGGGNGLIVSAWVFLVFSPITKFFEDLHTNY